MKRPRALLLAAMLVTWTGSNAAAQHDYKVSRKLLRNGAYQAALKLLGEQVRESPEDSEWVYQLAIAQTP